MNCNETLKQVDMLVDIAVKFQDAMIQSHELMMSQLEDIQWRVKQLMEDSDGTS